MVLVQAYVLPETAVAPIDMDEPAQIAVLVITDADGSAFTVIVTEFESVHPLEPVSITE